MSLVHFYSCPVFLFGHGLVFTCKTFVAVGHIRSKLNLVSFLNRNVWKRTHSLSFGNFSESLLIRMHWKPLWKVILNSQKICLVKNSSKRILHMHIIHRRWSHFKIGNVNHRRFTSVVTAKWNPSIEPRFILVKVFLVPTVQHTHKRFNYLTIWTFSNFLQSLVHRRENQGKFSHPNLVSYARFHQTIL